MISFYNNLVGSTTVSNMTNFVNNSFRGKLDKGSTIIGKSNVKAKFIIDFAVDALKQHWKKKSGENDKNKDDLNYENILIDKTSADLLKGSEVDYVSELIGEQFKITNPQTKSSCGCGVSFSL